MNELQIDTLRKEEETEENGALKSLVTKIDRLFGMVLDQDRTIQFRKRYLHTAILRTEWGHHARAKIRRTENLGETIETLHEAIDYIT